MKLRELQQKDAVDMLSWMHDDSINQYFKVDFKIYSIDQVKKFIDKKNDDRNLNYACVDDNDIYLGTISLKNIDYDARNAEYAISFKKTAQGTGAAQFATKEILKIAFEKIKLERVYLNVLSENVRANRFYEKMGFVYEGEFKKHLNIRGNLKDLKWYRILREEYAVMK